MRLLATGQRPAGHETVLEVDGTGPKSDGITGGAFDRSQRQYVDEAGLYTDFHALRPPCVSLITKGGVHPTIAQSNILNSGTGIPEMSTTRESLFCS